VEEGCTAVGLKGAGGSGAKAASEVATAKDSSPAAFKVLYRFNEGYTNAVKRPLLMSELI
jgi:chromosome transmission fidelity protein 18